MEKLGNQQEKLQRYWMYPVGVSIRGGLDEDQAPLFHKKLVKAALCSENTHLEFFFESNTFVAVPLDCQSWWEGEQLTAYDKDKNLLYRFEFTIAAKEQ